MRNIVKKAQITFIAVSLFSIGSLFNSSVHAQTMDASFELNPAEDSLIMQCPARIDIMVNTGSNASNAANIVVTFDPNDIEITDQDDAKDGLQIETGEAYTEYTDNLADPTTGTITLTGYTLEQIEGTYRFASIHFEPRSNVEGTEFSIQFNGIHETHDSNIAEYNTSDDILASVTNGTYTFEQGSCFKDEEPPIIDPIDPQNFDVGVDKDGNVVVDITDVTSGVDITTVTITINGVAYTHEDTEYFSYTGSPGKYTITIKPKVPFQEGSPVYVVFRAADYAGNWATASILFNIPPEACSSDTLSDELQQCKDELASCQSTGPLPSLPLTGLDDISQYLGLPCYIYFLPLLIIFFHPYWRNPKGNDLIRKLTKEKGTIPAILFIIGFLIALFGLFDCFSILCILNVVLYVATLIQLYIRKRMADNEPEGAYE